MALCCKVVTLCWAPDTWPNRLMLLCKDYEEKDCGAEEFNQLSLKKKGKTGWSASGKADQILLGIQTELSVSKMLCVSSQSAYVHTCYQIEKWHKRNELCLYKCYKNLNISPFFESITLFSNKETTILLILSTYRNINEVVPIYNPPKYTEKNGAFNCI